MKVIYSNVPNNGHVTNSLIYITAFGEKYCEMANILIMSIRKYGNFVGDIIVFTDTPRYDFGNCVTTIKSTLPDVSPYVSRFYFLEQLSLKGYEYIMYLDSDMICRGDISRIFNIGTNLGYVEEPWIYYSKALNHLYFTKFDSCEVRELKETKLHPINSGQFIIHTSRIQDFVKSYMLIYNSNDIKGYGSDQSALNTLVRRGFPNCVPIDKSIFRFTQAQENQNGYKFWHYAGDRNALRNMKQDLSYL